jgi:hypothetical protein
VLIKVQVCVYACLPVISEVVLPSESLTADVARIRSLVRMRSFVDKQVVRLGELPLTVFTDELFLWSVKELG